MFNYGHSFTGRVAKTAKDPGCTLRTATTQSWRERSEIKVTAAIEAIVEGYVKLGNRQALEDLLAHRRRLAADFTGRTGGPIDASASLNQIVGEIASIENGIRLLGVEAKKPIESFSTGPAS
jgi:hypothetical protein